MARRLRSAVEGQRHRCSDCCFEDRTNGLSKRGSGTGPPQAARMRQKGRRGLLHRFIVGLFAATSPNLRLAQKAAKHPF
jgi:hypothetical protein